MDIEQVLRRWLAGEGIRAIARSTALARNTVKRLVKLAGEQGLKPGEGFPEETKLQAIREGIGRPGGPEASSTGQILGNRKEQIQHWLEKDRLLLTKVHELLVREGIEVSYSSWSMIMKTPGSKILKIHIVRLHRVPPVVQATPTYIERFGEQAVIRLRSVFERFVKIL